MLSFDKFYSEGTHSFHPTLTFCLKLSFAKLLKDSRERQWYITALPWFNYKLRKPKNLRQRKISCFWIRKWNANVIFKIYSDSSRINTRRHYNKPSNCKKFLKLNKWREDGFMKWNVGLFPIKKGKAGTRTWLMSLTTTVRHNSTSHRFLYIDGYVTMFSMTSSYPGNLCMSDLRHLLAYI